MVRTEYEIWQDDINRKRRRGPSYGVLLGALVLFSLACWAVVIFALRHGGN